MAQRANNQEILALSRRVLSRHARSFRWAAIFLHRRQRDDAAVLYAFCRLVDDVVDEASDPAAARRGLACVAEDLERETPRDALIATFKAVAARRGIPLSAARDLIAGAASDLETVRVADDRELLRYCYRVAGTVGLMMCPILGVHDDAAKAHAVDLGIAMQLTNISRDVLEDAGRDRVYLPATRLEAVGESQTALLTRRADRGRVAMVVCGLLEFAEGYYASADDGMRFIPVRPRLAIYVAGRLYRSIGLRLATRYRGDALHGRTVISPWRKMLWVGRAIGAWLRSLLRRGATAAHPRALHQHLDGLTPAE
jgi:phytoene synthase